jgi:hypothetical protein
VTHRRRGERALVVLAAALAGCAHPTRLGPAFPLPAGDPQNGCEAEGWVELVAAEFRPDPGLFAPPRTYNGAAVFRTNGAGAADLDEVLPRMGEPDLQARHEARIKPAEAANRRALTAALIGLGGMFAGVGTAAALNDRNHDAANVFGVSGLAIGLVGVVVAIILSPSDRDRTDAEARQKLFLEDEDDKAAVERGVNRVNEATRQGCRATARTAGPAGAARALN